jgi:GrpB-like predicted nucleotidyltransferase (UPF0157 family)
MKEKIIILDHDPLWTEQFSKISQYLNMALGDVVKEIQHVGSTAVPGLKAKPILDIDIILKDLSFLKKAIGNLEKIGYKYLGEMGISGRFALQAPRSLSFGLHNTYICDPLSEAYLNHIYLRDHLMENLNDRLLYSKLKDRLASLYPYDIDRYVEGKTNFISSILEKKGMDKKMVDRIRKENFK